MTSTHFRLTLALVAAAVGCTTHGARTDVDARTAADAAPGRDAEHVVDDAGCIGYAGSRCVRPPTDDDRDGDGHPGSESDCDDLDYDVFPGAYDQPCDGIDNDCAGGDDCPPDEDRDGTRADEDCDDHDASRYAGAVERACDGVDQNCDGADACDADGDGSWTPGDCDDSDPAVGDTLAEVICDGVDNDCERGDCCDGDHDLDGFACREDCDDGNELVYPGAPVDPGCYAEDRNCDGEVDGVCTGL